MSMRALRYLPAVVVVMSIALLGGGIADPPLPAAAQEELVMIELGVSHERVNPGECALVEWGVHRGGDWPVIFEYALVDPHGHQEVCPQTTTNYTLSVETPEGVVSKEVTILVGDGPDDEGMFREDEPWRGGEEFPVHFQVVDPEAIPRGACATLIWEVGDMEESLVIVNGEEAPRVGNIRICPEETTRYELIVEGPEGPAIREIILNVIDVHGEGEHWEGMSHPEMEGEPPEGLGEISLSLTADPDAVPRGGCAALNWEVNPPVEYPILLNGQIVAPQGSQQICPETTTTYELLVETPGGPVVRHLMFHVEEGPSEGPEPTAMPPAQPTQPPSSQPGGPAQDTVDLAVTDLYADKDIQGTVHLRVTNNGHATLSNARVEIKCGNQGKPLGNQQPWSHVEAPWIVNLSLKPGETGVVPSKMIVDTSQYTYEAWCSARSLDHSETNDQNNRYDETITRVGAAPQPPQPPKSPGKPGSGADVHPTDLYIESGALITRITNDGPDALTNKKVKVTVDGCGAGKEHMLSLAPGQTQAMDTYCQPAAGKKSYKVTTSAVDFTDPNGGNNSYTETLDPGSGKPAPPPGGSSWGILTANLAVTDLYPENAPKGRMMVRFTNRGPDTISGVNLLVTCEAIAYPLTQGSALSTVTKDFTPNVTLNKGQTAAYYTTIDLDTAQQWYMAKCTIKPGWKDPTDNSYQEMIGLPSSP